MFSVWHALVLGVVEGLTEFLPVSSTGHLILTSQALGLGAGEFVKSFEIIIQLGAILAVLVIYGRSALSRIENWAKIVVAFLPTAVIGLAFYKIVKTYLLGNVSVVLWSLALGGFALILFEKLYTLRNRVSDDGSEKAESFLEVITYRQALLIGVAQSVAIIPGVSRSAATIMGGLALGLSRRTIVEFSFLLALPTMIAATGLDLWHNAGSFSVEQFSVLLVGFLTAFFVAWLAIKYFLRFIQNHTFIVFGWYRIFLAVIVAVFLTHLL